MKTIYSVFLLLAWVIAAPALAAKDAVNTKGIGNSAAIRGYDAVAYWSLKEGSEAVKGSKEFTTEWHGAEWRFASQENLDTFKADPTKYAPQYGGYCAWAMADGKGRTVSVDPDSWSIYKDKLYLNYNARVLEEWLKTKDADIEVADRNYPNITDVKSYK